MEYLQTEKKYSFGWTAPSSLLNSKTFSAIFYALEPALQLLGANAGNGAIYLRWLKNGTLNSEEFDLLAIGFDLQNYDPAWSVEKKAEVLNGCLFEKAHLGTVYAVKKAISIISNATILQDWFEQTPPAQPYTFRLVTDWDKLDVELSAKKIRELISYVNYNKAARCLWSWDIRAKAENELKIMGPYGRAQLFRRLDKQDGENAAQNELKISGPLYTNFVYSRI